jgi:transposase
VDWGQFGSIAVGNTRRRLSFFVMVLCYSRMLYVEFTVSETMEHFLACHANAFDFFGGVPERIMVDNLRSAVLRHAMGQARAEPRSRARDHSASSAPVASGRRMRRAAWRTPSGTSRRTSWPAWS